ncbi:hypothetical protein QR680_003321 [Steinernema hermaphroditum]|uniref:DnaJ homolog subfamily C member 2 n=1 Tax=Steinernema hermaphroditum TaxID=289476 RepID=A0AA39H6A8_9BILA|nr:hypothetical protein QR680_003321 [Steinernema hermaphroditum]
MKHIFLCFRLVMTQLNLAVAIYGFLPRRRVVERAGIWYEAAVVREKLEKGIDTSPNSSEGDLEALLKQMDPDDDAYLRYVKKLDPTDTKNQDHYKVLGLSKLRYKATKNDIKLAYKQKSLSHHPDKRENSEYFACIINAYNMLYLGDQKAYDSVDPTFDDEIPAAGDINAKNFFNVLTSVFEMNARFSTKQPVPELGDDSTPRADVEHFYDFWFDFDTWREFSYLDEEDKERGEDRWERRQIEKTNKAEREKKRKAEMKRVRTLVEIAYSADPRIQRFKLLDKQQKEQAKIERRLAQQKKKEQERLGQEEEQRKREEQERLEKQKAADEKKQRELGKKALQQARKALRQAADSSKYWADCHEKQMRCMEEVERICLAADKDVLNELAAKLADIKLYDDALDLMLNACRKEDTAEATKAKVNSTAKDVKTSWTMNENQLLIKASTTFPVGTVDRWNQMAAYINEHRTDKSTRPKTEKDVIKQVKAVQNMQFKPATDQHKLGNGVIVNGTSETAAPKSEDDWSALEQKRLEEGLKMYTSSDPARWDKIAALVENKTKKDCMRRYKKLVEMVKSKKASGYILFSLMSLDQRSVRFSAKPPLTYPPLDEDRNVDFLRAFDQLPLPQIQNDDAYVADILTASSVGAVDVVQDLISRGANAKKENVSKWTALMYAAYLGHDNVCEYILQVVPGCVNQKNAKGQTALMLAASCGNMSTVKSLVKKSDLTISDQSGCTALHYAVQCSQLNAAELLLEYGADPNFPDLKGMTPTLIACGAGHELILGVLLQKDGDPFKVNNARENGLTLAADYPKIQKAIDEWKTAQNDNAEITSVSALLRVLKLEKYQDIFEQNHINLRTFFRLTDSDLYKLGIIPFGPRKKLVNVIERFKSNGVIATEPEAHYDGRSDRNAMSTRAADNSTAEEEIRRLRIALATQRAQNNQLIDFALTSKTTLSQVLEQLRLQQPAIPHHIYINMENQLHELTRKVADIERSFRADDFL